jgi:hypothetical protein
LKRSPVQFAVFILVLFAWLIAAVFAAGLLNLTGDCYPEVTNCGETQRQIGFVVLGLGVVGAIWIIIRFVRHPEKFWRP